MDMGTFRTGTHNNKAGWEKGQNNKSKNQEGITTTRRRKDKVNGVRNEQNRTRK